MPATAPAPSGQHRPITGRPPRVPRHQFHHEIDATPSLADRLQAQAAQRNWGERDRMEVPAVPFDPDLTSPDPEIRHGAIADLNPAPRDGPDT